MSNCVDEQKKYETNWINILIKFGHLHLRMSKYWYIVYISYTSVWAESTKIYTYIATTICPYNWEITQISNVLSIIWQANTHTRTERTRTVSNSIYICNRLIILLLLQLTAACVGNFRMVYFIFSRSVYVQIYYAHNDVSKSPSKIHQCAKMRNNGRKKNKQRKTIIACTCTRCGYPHNNKSWRTRTHTLSRNSEWSKMV